MCFPAALPAFVEVKAGDAYAQLYGNTKKISAIHHNCRFCSLHDFRPALFVNRNKKHPKQSFSTSILSLTWRPPLALVEHMVPSQHRQHPHGGARPRQRNHDERPLLCAAPEVAQRGRDRPVPVLRFRKVAHRHDLWEGDSRA